MHPQPTCNKKAVWLNIAWGFLGNAEAFCENVPSLVVLPPLPLLLSLNTTRLRSANTAAAAAATDAPHKEYT